MSARCLLAIYRTMFGKRSMGCVGTWQKKCDAVPVLPSMQLPQRLVEHHARRRGKVEASNFTGWHGDAIRAVCEAVANSIRQTVRFIAKQDTVAIAKGSLRVGERRCRLDTNHVIAPDDCLEAGKCLVLLQIHRVPVIHPGPPQRSIVEAKAASTDEVEPGPRRRAQPGHVAGVRRYFWLPQGDMQHADPFLDSSLHPF